MFKLRKGEDKSEIRFCERCGSACDASCFEQESRERAFAQLLRHGRWVG
jgi:hypothetical protein